MIRLDNQPQMFSVFNFALISACFCRKFVKILPKIRFFCRAQPKPQLPAPAGLSRIILTVANPASHPEKYNFQVRAMLGSSLAMWELL